MNDTHVRLRSEPGEPWAIWYDREHREIFLSVGYFGLVESKPAANTQTRSPTSAPR